MGAVVVDTEVTQMQSLTCFCGLSQSPWMEIDIVLSCPPTGRNIGKKREQDTPRRQPVWTAPFLPLRLRHTPHSPPHTCTQTSHTHTEDGMHIQMPCTDGLYVHTYIPWPQLCGWSNYTQSPGLLVCWYSDVHVWQTHHQQKTYLHFCKTLKTKVTQCVAKYGFLLTCTETRTRKLWVKSPTL